MGAFAQRAGDVGLQGLGTLLNVVDTAIAARQGQLGQHMLQRSLALQDPNARESIGSSPFMAGLLGLYGHRQGGTPGFDVAPGVSSPEMLSAVEAARGQPLTQPMNVPGTPSRFQANLPPLGPAASTKQAIEATNLPYRTLQMKALESKLGTEVEQARYLKRFNDIMGQLGGGGDTGQGAGDMSGGMAGPAGLSLNTIGFTPTGGTIGFGQPPEPVIKGLPAGSPNPVTGQPLTGPQKIGRRTTVVPTPQAGQLQNAQRTENALGALDALQGILKDQSPGAQAAVKSLGVIGNEKVGVGIPYSNPTWASYKYLGGLGLSSEQLRLMEAIGYFHGTGFQGLLAGIRNPDVIKDIQVHLPTAQDTPKLIQSKIDYLRDRYSDALAANPSAVVSGVGEGTSGDPRARVLGGNRGGSGAGGGDINARRKALGLPPMQ